MSDRFFTATPIQSDRVRLTGDEAHHLAHVMRAKAGTTVTLFDGSGGEFEARIDRIGSADVELTIVSRRESNIGSLTWLTLAIALPKGDRQRWLVEKAVELGVGRIVPLIAERSVAQPVESALARLRRTAIEASKQCGRNKLLEVCDAYKWSDLAAQPLGSALRLIAHPGGKPIGSVWPAGERPEKFESVIVAIGPEGGFANEEAQMAMDAGWTPVSLGPLILRVETAAIAVAAWASLCQSD